MAQYNVTWTDMPADGGRSYEFVYDTECLGLREARDVKKWTGMNPPEWLAAMGIDDPDALGAMVCLLRRREGEPDLRFSDVDLNYGSMKLEAVVEEGADPPR